MHSTVRTPSPAERAKTAVVTATSVRLGILNLSHEVEQHLLALDGSLIMQPAASSPARVLALAGSVSPWVGTATALDVTSVPHADRLRARVTLTGPVEALSESEAGPVRTALARRSVAASGGPASPISGPILRMRPTKVALEWLGADPVQIAGHAYRSALPDPFAHCQAEWLAHLHRTHAAALQALAVSELGEAAEPSEARPLLVDRHGLVLRVYPGDPRRPAQDLRIAFPRAVSCACEGAEVLNELCRLAGVQQTSCHHDE